MTRQVTDALEHYRFADAARTLYDFAWDEFCSFYVEMVKARFAEPEQRAAAQRVLAHALDTLLRLLHPMMPFITEEIWQLLGQVAPSRAERRRSLSRRAAAESVCIAAWPVADTSRTRTPTIEARFADFQEVLGAVREIRSAAEHSPQGRRSSSPSAATRRRRSCSSRWSRTSRRWRSDGHALGPAPPSRKACRSASRSRARTGRIEVYVDLAGSSTSTPNASGSKKERDKLAKLIASIEGKLSQQGVRRQAPAGSGRAAARQAAPNSAGQLASVEAALEKLGK